VLFLGNGWADQVPDTPGSHVVDLAGIIGPQTKIDINRYLKELEQKTTAQMAILTVKSLEGQSIEAFSINVAHDKWKLGQKGKDNGVLLTVALKERKYRIEVGYGLEGVLPDSLVGGIGRSVLVPNFKKGQYSQGVMAATIAIANKIAGDAGVTITGMPRVKPAVRKSSRSSGLLSKLFSLGFFIILFLFFIRRPRSFLALFLLSSMGARRGHWGGSSGGFGGGGFGGFSGGGGFGGGGASGGW
jgi:uncharacterized protein